MLLENSILEKILSNSTIEGILFLMIGTTFSLELLKNILVVNKREKKKVILTYLSILIIFSLSSKNSNLFFAMICTSTIYIFVKIICSIKINTYQNQMIIFSSFILLVFFKALAQTEFDINTLYFKEIYQIAYISLKTEVYLFSIFTLLPMSIANLLCILTEIIDFIKNVISLITRLLPFKIMKLLEELVNKILSKLKIILSKRNFNFINDKLSDIIKITGIIVLFITIIIVENPTYNFLEGTKKCFELIIFSSIIPLLLSTISQKKNQK